MATAAAAEFKNGPNSIAAMKTAFAAMNVDGSTLNTTHFKPEI